MRLVLCLLNSVFGIHMDEEQQLGYILSEEQKQSWHDNGYLVLENVVDQSVLERIRWEYSGILDGLIETWVAQGLMEPPSEGDDFFTKLHNTYLQGLEWYQHMDISFPGSKITKDTPMHMSEAIFDMIKSPNILDVVEQLIGGEITSNPIQHVRIKPPAGQLRAGEARAHVAHADWHQDKGVITQAADETPMVTVWVAVTDATLENGCLQVVPKQPDQALLKHCNFQNDKLGLKQVAIAKQHREEEKAVPLPVKSGWAIIFNPLTPHASRRNDSCEFRWSFDLRYSKTNMPTGRDHFPSFIARSRENPELEVTDWKESYDAWMHAREVLSEQEENINLHRWPEAQGEVCA